jgi:ParB/RepB/Spo0J family partition protein
MTDRLIISEIEYRLKRIRFEEKHLTQKGERQIHVTDLKHVSIDDIEPNRANPREPRGRQDIQDLMESIREVGVLVPLVVFRKKGTKSKFVLLEGERRLRACKQLYKQTKDQRFSEVPVNILREPPDKLQNLLTMFNVHTKRKPWSRPAEAEALGILEKLGGSRTSNTAKIALITGLNPIRVEEDLTYLKFPKDIRAQAYAGKLGKYNLILLGRNLKSIEDTFPTLMEKYGTEKISRTLIGKVTSRRIRRARDFNKLSSLAKVCILNKHEETYARAFDRLMNDQQFNIDDMEQFVTRELGFKVDEAFRINCKSFLDALTAHAEHRNFKVDVKTYDLLTRIAEAIQGIRSA